ncbi:MAG: hypothetical protein APR54_04855 [Candidatus Cloacimonas sp. SDB]|nr:MAG: hypothetical protein APR54_04855 [Candidatus Cloacimonas sp. SDB]
MRYFRLSLLALIVFSASFIAAEEYQDLTSEGKKNLRSANMHLGGERIEKALPLYFEVVNENPYHIESLKKIAGIYYDFKKDYYKASEYYQNAIAAIDKEIEVLEKEISENPKKEKKINKEIDSYLEDREFLVKLNTSCWTQLFVNAQYKFTIANDFYSLNPQNMDLTDPDNISAINDLLQKVMVDTINVETVAEDPVNIEEISAPFDNLLDDTIADFKKLYDFAPDSIKTIKMLSYAYNVKQDEEESLNYLIKVAELDPEDELVRQQIANHYYNSGNYDEALKWFQSAAEANPENPDSYFNMGITYEKLENHEEAFKAFEKVVEIDPENLDAILYASNIASKIDRKDDSINYLKMAIELDPGNINYLSFISYNLFQKKKYDEVIIYAQKWFDTDNKSKEAAQLIYQSAKNIDNTELMKKYEKILIEME